MTWVSQRKTVGAAAWIAPSLPRTAPSPANLSPSTPCKLFDARKSWLLACRPHNRHRSAYSATWCDTPQRAPWHHHRADGAIITGPLDCPAPRMHCPNQAKTRTAPLPQSRAHARKGKGAPNQRSVDSLRQSTEFEISSSLACIHDGSATP